MRLISQGDGLQGLGDGFTCFCGAEAELLGAIGHFQSDSVAKNLAVRILEDIADVPGSLSGAVSGQIFIVQEDASAGGLDESHD